MINLDRLKKILGGRQEQIKEILNLFIIEIPPAIMEIRRCCQAEDWKLMKNKIHGIKSYFDYLGLNELYQQINNWEKSLPANPTAFNHGELINMLEMEAKAVILEIKKVLN